MYRRLAVLLPALLAAVAAIAPPARADPTPATDTTVVGGPELAGRGIIVHPGGGVAAPPKVSASSYVIADYDSGQVLAAKDPHGRYLPASTLKILTAVALIPALDPRAAVRPSWQDCNVEGSKVGVVEDMSYQVDDLFRGLLMVSGNDAALALADAAGGLPRALSLMNAEAQRLNARDTVAKTPHGLDARGQYSSAYDLALITRAGLRMPQFRRYIATPLYHFPAPRTKEQRQRHQPGGYMIYNHNRLLHEYPGGIGVKNGYTDAARATFVGAATRGGHTVIVALMHSDPYFWDDVKHLLDWGFAAEGRVRPVGVLVEPGPLATAVASPAGERRPTPAPVARHRDNTGFPWLPVTVGAGGALALLGYVAARRGWRGGARPPT